MLACRVGQVLLLLGGILYKIRIFTCTISWHILKNFLELELKLTLRCATGPGQCLELTGNLPTKLRESIRQRISMRIAPCLKRQLEAARRQKFPPTSETQTQNEAPGRVRSERGPKDEPIPPSFDPRGLHSPKQWPPGHRKLGETSTFGICLWRNFMHA